MESVVVVPADPVGGGFLDFVECGEAFRMHADVMDAFSLVEAVYSL